MNNDFDPTNMKPAYRSKTVVVNSVAVAAFGALAAYWPEIAPIVKPMMPEQAFALMGVGLGVVNVVLRAVTTRSITWSKDF